MEFKINLWAAIFFSLLALLILAAISGCGCSLYDALASGINSILDNIGKGLYSIFNGIGTGITAILASIGDAIVTLVTLLFNGEAISAIICAILGKSCCCSDSSTAASSSAPNSLASSALAETAFTLRNSALQVRSIISNSDQGKLFLSNNDSAAATVPYNLPSFGY